MISWKVAILGCSVMWSSNAYAKADQDTTSPVESAPAHDESASLDTFLKDKSAQHGRAMAAFQSRGKGGEASEMRRMIKGAITDPPRPTGDANDPRNAQLAESLANDAADYLAGLGYKPGSLRSESGFDRGQAAVRLIRGAASQDDRLSLAPFVIAAEVVDVVFEDLGDGYHSTAIVKPVSVVKGPRGAPLSPELRIRQRSGMMTARGRALYASEFKAGDHGTFLLALSDEFYAHSAAARGKSPASRGGATYMVRVTPDAVPVTGSGAAASVRLESGEVSLGELKNRLAASAM